jgi:hypothetical protein
MPLIYQVHGTRCPPALLSHWHGNDGIEDNTPAPEAHDDAEFDIPDTQAMLERFMSDMSAGYDEQGRFAHLHNLVRFLFNGHAYHIQCIC